MKIMTKQLYHSETFYGYFRWDRGLSFCEFLEQIVHRAKGYPYYRGEDSINYLYNQHRIDDYINYYKNYLYRYGDIKDIMLDENGRLKEMNEEIYYKVLEIAKEHGQYSRIQYELLREQRESLCNTEGISCNIKKLIAFLHHDDKIYSINQDENMLSFECGGIIYVFENADISCDIELSEIVKGFHVVDEEYYYDSNKKVYEYCMLLRKWNTEGYDEIHYMSITFRELISITDVPFE